jgi:hypothetical protein
VQRAGRAFASATIPAAQTPFFGGAIWVLEVYAMGVTDEGPEAHVKPDTPTRVSSLRQDLKLRDLNPTAGLRAIHPRVGSVRALLGS